MRATPAESPPVGPNPDPRRRIYLMRHGSVNYFQPDGRPLPPATVALSPRGREEARAAGRMFASRQIRFDRVVTSGLARTVETASEVLAAAGLDLPLEHRPALEEIRGGRLADIHESDLWQAFTAATGNLVGAEVRFLGGESIGELQDRIIPEFDVLRADRTWRVLLLVLHGAVNRALLSYLATGRRLMLGAFEQSPAGINVIDVGTRKEDVVLRAINLSPLDPLHPDERRTTMEELHGQYLRHRSAATRDG